LLFSLFIFILNYVLVTFFHAITVNEYWSFQVLKSTHKHSGSTIKLVQTKMHYIPSLLKVCVRKTMKWIH